MTIASAAPRVGIDLVRISRIEESLQRFGDRFMRRLFSDDEVAYATAVPALCAERLAARFAAKEATLKALSIADAGIGWRDIEVRRAECGDCAVVLHGGADEAARRVGLTVASVSLTHEGDYAAAVVLVQPNCLLSASKTET